MEWSPVAKECLPKTALSGALLEFALAFYLEPQHGVVARGGLLGIVSRTDMQRALLRAVAGAPHRREQHLILPPGVVGLAAVTETAEQQMIALPCGAQRHIAATEVKASQVVDRQRSVAAVEASLERVEEKRTRRRLHHTGDLAVVGLQSGTVFLCYSGTTDYQQTYYSNYSLHIRQQRYDFFPTRLKTFCARVRFNLYFCSMNRRSRGMPMSTLKKK